MAAIDQGGALPKINCKICDRTEVTVETWNHDRTKLVGVKVHPVPDDFPYCWTCYHTGDAIKDQSGDIIEAVTSVTGTKVNVWNTGGGTMTGFVELFPDSDIHASFCIVHDDNTAEACGHFTLELWGEEEDAYAVQEGWTDHDVEWLDPLIALWESARLQVDLPEEYVWTPAQVNEWFRLVWADTVRVVDENRDKWGGGV